MRDTNRLSRMLAALALVLAACGGDSDTGNGTAGLKVGEGEPEAGGRMKWISDVDVDYVDPAGTYYVVGTMLHRGVSRTLTSYPFTTDIREQTQPVPDLATDTGQPNDDFTEWTYTLKDGIKWGPAMGGEEVDGVTGEEIVCADVKYGVERMFNPSVGAQYSYYYDMIEGAKNAEGGPLEGIECDGDKTIIFHLTESTPDWPFRVTMHATTPAPRSYVQQFDEKKESDYDRHVVASGPYYIAAHSPAESMRLERNTYWDPSTDDIREAYVDGVDWKMGVQENLAVQKLVENEYDVPIEVAPPGPQLERIATTEELSQRFLNQANDCTYYIFLNTTVEPFDNLKVRQAVNYGIDRENLVRLRGGPLTGPVATSPLPPGVGGHVPTEEFDPFSSPNHAGDIEKAKELMEQAGYGDGYDEKLLLVSASGPPTDEIAESVRKDLEKIGFGNVVVKLPEYPNNYTQWFTIPDQNVAVGASAGWCKDWPDALTFLDPLFNGDNILESGNSNYSEIDDPELNQLIEEAKAIPPGDDRIEAWEVANRKAAELAVWVPFQWAYQKIILSERVVNAVFHTYFTNIDWVNAAVNGGGAE